MIKQTYADYFGGAYKLAGSFDVFGAGGERAARVIVSDDKGIRIIDDRSFNRLNNIANFMVEFTLIIERQVNHKRFTRNPVTTGRKDKTWHEFQVVRR